MGMGVGSGVRGGLLTAIGRGFSAVVFFDLDPTGERSLIEL
jgi:hypothetical protein